MKRSLLLSAAGLIIAGAIAANSWAERDDDDRDDDGGRYAIGLWGDLPYSRPAGDGRRAEPDRRHERAAISRSRSTTAISRPAAAPRLDHADDLQRRPVRAGARLSSTRSKRRRCSRPATTTGPTAIGPPTAASTRSSGSTTSAAFLRHAVLARAAPAAPGGAVDAAVPRRQRPDAVRREPPLDAVEGVTYATLNVQGSCNNLCDTAPEPGRVRARNAANIAWLQRDLRRGDSARLGGGDADRAGRSRAST